MLEEIIRLQFAENTDYNNPGQAVNQMQSLNALSKDLYTDSTRFIYELLQNADDSCIDGSKVKVSIKLFEKNLVIAHTGKSFDNRDIQGICAINNGTKKEDNSKTGFKGIGFKSVFAQSGKVTIFSQGEYFRFDESYAHDWKWKDTKAIWESNTRRLFKYPWQIIPIYTEKEDVNQNIHHYLHQSGASVATIIEVTNTEEVTAAINELSDKVDMFLFLKNIVEINFNLAAPKVIGILPTDNNETLLTLDGETKAKYLLKNIVLSVPEDVKILIAEDSNVPEKLKLADNIEISFAAKVGDNGLEKLSSAQNLLYAYLPTEERRFSLPILVNTVFLTTANRETLHADSAWNQWLFKNIAIQLFHWIAELVTSDHSEDAYELLPEKLDGDNALARSFNNAYEQSIIKQPFLLTYEDNLIGVNSALIDETFLILHPLFGQDLIRNFTIASSSLQNIDSKPFVPHRKYTSKLKKMGVSLFRWADLKKLLATTQFVSSQDTSKNTALINEMYIYSQLENPAEINDDSLQTWPFILDHKMTLKSPQEVFFPQVDDTSWNSLDSELSFLHPSVQEWLDGNIAVKLWLGKLGVVEKSDLTFFNKSILPNVSTFITVENALETVKSIFMLFKRNEINSETLSKLSTLKVLTLEGNLLPANQTYFSAAYEPVLDLQPHLVKDFYLSKLYISSQAEVYEWKRFFKYFEVQERITIFVNSTRESKGTWIASGFDKGYFDMEDKRFWSGYFRAHAYSGLRFPALMEEMSQDATKAKLLWSDLIRHNELEAITKDATAFWGHSGKPSDTTGNSVANYTKWYIQNNDCIPTTAGNCQSSSNVYLNDEKILEVAGRYLPVFDGPSLTADWRSFFGFITSLKLDDYLSILESVSKDEASDNKSRIHAVYEYLLESFKNLGASELETIKNWGLAAKLLDKKGYYSPAGSLKYYPDGDPSIFQGKLNFIDLSSANRKHPDVADLLDLLGIGIIEQGSFELFATNENDAEDLRTKILEIIPYFAKWTESEAHSGYAERRYELETRLEKLSFKTADQLVITLGTDWQKEVSVYIKGNVLHVLTDWKANDVLLMLTSKLCEFLKTTRYESELGFLLRSEANEIERHFRRENIELPEIKTTLQKSDVLTEQSRPSQSDFKKPIDYQALWNTNIERNAVLIENASGDSKRLLIEGLKGHSAGQETCIYHFSHLENAVAIIKDQQIKSRQLAMFKDSAGSGIISQTLEDRKQYARFYFRSHTPTQFYVENWGRGQYSIDHLNGEPVCPVPVFFVIPIQRIIDSVDWKVSLGTMASPNVEYGNTIEIVSRFDFDGLYKKKSEIDHDRYMAASHQEFLIKDSLKLEDAGYRLVVQDNEARKSLLVMLGDDEKWGPLISVDTGLFYNENPKIKVNKSNYELSSDFKGKMSGRFILQFSESEQWKMLDSEKMIQYFDSGVTTSVIEDAFTLFSDFDVLKYNLYYGYKGQLWLIDTNNDDSSAFNTDHIKTSLVQWAHSGKGPSALIASLKMHPELQDWFNTSIGGIDGLNLEQHTIEVASNYQKYFNCQQKIFDDESTFLLFLTLHDIGKPLAIVKGNKHDQHENTIHIIDTLSEILPIDTPHLEMVKILINADPIGRYLNPAVSQELDQTVAEMIKMQGKLGIPFKDYYQSYIIYYQCDASGYRTLRSFLFEMDAEGELFKHPEKNRLMFKEPHEARFIKLEEQLELL